MTNLFPPNTKIKDFGYPESHPFHIGNYPLLTPTTSSSSSSSIHSSTSLSLSIPITDEINCKARAIFDFNAENDNEISLVEGQIIWISYRHGQGWLVAEDPENGENGLVPEEYVEIIREVEEDVPKRFLPEIFSAAGITNGDEQQQQEEEEEDSEWVDTEGEDDEVKVVTEEEGKTTTTNVDDVSEKLKTTEI
ncbi:hypothetical protein G210_1924 [Candida maltosa Xu316]|uniref:SH3 domain-containing protein n=1 Tax=Candida maltosa (strain Xu316) TaxID=1245528 RepID=M3J6J4_CANMX|nr:hypothetical protein G210_1924 [Candida maltosa Xu316]